MKEKMFTGEFFIIPNHFYLIDENDIENPFNERITKDMEDLGLSVKDGDYLVQIWAVGSSSNNWHCHGNAELIEFLFPEKEKEGMTYRFPQYLPYDILKDVKEGGEIILTHCSGKKIKLVANQSSYRYRSYGPFQNVLARVKTASDKLYTEAV